MPIRARSFLVIPGIGALVCVLVAAALVAASARKTVEVAFYAGFAALARWARWARPQPAR